MDIKPKGKKQKVRRYYDKLAELLPEFRPTQKLVSNVFSIVDHTKRGVTHSLRRPKTPKIEENFNGEFTDYDYQRVLEMSQNSHFSKPFEVPEIPPLPTLNPISLSNSFIHYYDEEEEVFFEEEEINSLFKNTQQRPLFAAKRGSSTASSNASSTRSLDKISGFSSKVFRIDDDDSSTDEDAALKKNVIKIDKTGFPEIPPLATDLVQFLETIPDSAPASLSPYTFNEEVSSLGVEDFQQFLEEDTLAIKSALYGGRFDDNSLFDFFISLSSEQHNIATAVYVDQFFKISLISNVVRDLLQYESPPDAAKVMEDVLSGMFYVKTAMVWINIPSAKMLINHSRLMKYPHGVGFVGTACVEKRQVVAPNPTRSPIYSEKYDLPFCEDAEIVVARPIIDPNTDEVYAVLFLIDKGHPSGATYTYWPQSELVLLQMFTDGAYRVFKRINQQYQHTEKLYKIAARFVQNQTNMFKLIESMQEHIKANVDCEKCSIYFKDEKSIYCFELKGKNVQKVAFLSSKGGIVSCVFESKKLVNAPVASEHPNFYNTIDGNYGSRPILAVPIMSGDSVFAVIACRGKKGICFTNDNVRTVEFLVAGAAPALKMSMSYREKMNELTVALRAQEKLAALLQAAEGLSRETSIDALVEQILHNACNLVGADRASLFVLDDARKNLITKVAHGTTKPFIIEVGKGIVGTVAESGQTINIPDCYQDERFNASVDKQTGYHTKSLMTIPVRDQNQKIIAVAQLMNKKTGNEFTTSDVELTKAMCVFTGIALSNSNVIETAVNSTKRVAAMLKTVSMLNHGEALSGILHHIMETSRDLVNADRCSLFMIDANKSKLTSTVNDGSKESINVSAGKGIVGFVASNGTILNIPDAYKDSRFHSGVDKATGYKTRSILAVPVKAISGEIIGVVEMINKDIIYNGGVFTQEDEKLTNAFSIFAGIAFDQYKSIGSGGHTLAINMTNMMNAEESSSWFPPKQIALSDEQMSHFNTFRFDVDNVNDVDRARFITSIFYKFGLSERFKIKNGKLIRFLLSVHEGYMKHSYYNWSRAVEIVQFVYYVLANTTLNTILTDVEKLALIVASICSDIDYTNTEEDKRGTEIALSVLYHNRPVMEMHHCEYAITLLSGTEENIFENLTADENQIVWKNIISLIIGTNMAKHYQTVSQFQSLLVPNIMINTKSPEHRLLLCQMVLKCADVSFVCRNFKVAQKRGMKAFKMFTDKTVIGKLFQRYMINSQIGFIVMYAEPIFSLLGKYFPEVDKAAEQVKSNLTDWKQMFVEVAIS